MVAVVSRTEAAVSAVIEEKEETVERSDWAEPKSSDAVLRNSSRRAASSAMTWSWWRPARLAKTPRKKGADQMMRRSGSAFHAIAAAKSKTASRPARSG